MDGSRATYSLNPSIAQLHQLIYRLINTIAISNRQVSRYLERSSLVALQSVCEIKLLLHKLIELPEGILGRYCADSLRFLSGSPTSSNRKSGGGCWGMDRRDTVRIDGLMTLSLLVRLGSSLCNGRVGNYNLPVVVVVRNWSILDGAIWWTLTWRRTVRREFRPSIHPVPTESPSGHWSWSKFQLMPMTLLFIFPLISRPIKYVQCTNSHYYYYDANKCPQFCKNLPPFHFHYLLGHIYISWWHVMRIGYRFPSGDRCGRLITCGLAKIKYLHFHPRIVLKSIIKPVLYRLLLLFPGWYFTCQHLHSSEA